VDALHPECASILHVRWVKNVKFPPASVRGAGERGRTKFGHASLLPERERERERKREREREREKERMLTRDVGSP